MIGIYKLNFEGTDKVYIGQSVNIKQRFSQHKQTLRAGTASPKLQEAFNKYGLPQLTTILICTSTNLDMYEESIINYYKSNINGFNTYSRPGEAPVLKGVEHGNAKYTVEQLETVFNILYNCPDISYIEIEQFTKVASSTIGNIAIGKSHIWLSEKYPIKYKEVVSNTGKRSRAMSHISNKLSAKTSGKIYPLVMSPEGGIYTIDNAYSFAREHYLAGNHFQEVLNGRRKSHKGWKLCQ